MSFEFLPTDQQQQWLTEALADLVRRRGCAPFLQAPLVEPSVRYFPDPWSFNRYGIERLTRRLLQYAELPLGVTIEFVQDAGIPARHDYRPVAAFLGIESGVCRFVYNARCAAGAAVVAGVMAHEVAHAYRHFHGLNQDDEAAEGAEDEEFLTDLTAVYLGFGILVVNNSERIASTGTVHGHVGTYRVERSSVGYLPPQAFSFLLGIQLSLRSLHGDPAENMARLLAPNQAEMTRRARELADGRSEMLSVQFGLPRKWPAQRRPEDVLKPLRRSPYPPNEPAPVVRSQRVDNSEGIVFRVCVMRPVEAGGMWAAGALIAGALIGQVLLPDRLGLFLGFVTAPIGFLVGREVSRRQGHALCSDRGCGSRIKASEARCPGCRGQVVGAISHINDRLHAEDEYHRKRLRPFGSSNLE